METPESNQVIDLEGFSVRTYNALKNAGIEKVQQLACYSEKDLLQLKNLGRRSINEIKEALDLLGMSLGSGPTDNPRINRKIQEVSGYLGTLRNERSVYDKEIERLETLIARLRGGDLADVPEAPEEQHIDPTTYRFPGLTERESLVVIARGAGRTLKDIADELGVTYVKVRELENTALRSLRHPRMFYLRPVIHQLGLCERVYSCCTCNIR